MNECFIITPIGERDSEIRREIDGVIESVFEPVLKEFDYTPVPAHQISETGSISKQMIKRLLESKLVIANLTGLNPNVMYEVGIRHCARKPLIVVAKEGTNLPFDLSDERTIFYKNDMSGSEELKNSLKEMIPKALKDKSPDNPVYRVVDIDLIKIPEGTSDESLLTNKRFSLIEDQLESIQTSLRNIPLSTATKKDSSQSVHISKKIVNRVMYKHRLEIFINLGNGLDELIALCKEIDVKYSYDQISEDDVEFVAYSDSLEDINKLKALIKKMNIPYASATPL